ncbi:hypothetical protein ACJ73_08893 [Blastomyces percursus]|uniref:Altered inheritance of mitochondria protein 21 n=1 Tax=Blastomyces percursus TaxID=1658174 RepID=A0A1J9PJU7_9EURO|nr:hypothetical protein ACJ73_08893 [Blastomyces percursus]
MSTKPFPVVPPRPSRPPNPRSSPNPEMPKVPARPNSRRIDRSTSPNCDRYSPSPLNELPVGSSTRHRHSNDASSPPARPPSVSLPSISQEGVEYEGLEYQNSSADNREQSHDPPVETRNVNRDLHLHAPKPSLPSSSAEARVRAVTRTDSQQAAAAGIGKVVSSPDYGDAERSKPRHMQTDGSRQGSPISSTNRRTSIHYGEEGGIPEIGQRVPMDPNAGDVQAPSPSPYGELGNEGEQHRPGRNHQHIKSGRDPSLPPGSYGLRGHGVTTSGKFEKAWYDKHPDELAREEQARYGPGLGQERPEWALSSDDLNKIVRSSAGTRDGLATHANVVGTPQEELAYVATDELASRRASVAPESRLSKGEYLQSHGLVKAPLKKSVVAGAADPEHCVPGTDTYEKEEVIHIDEPLHSQHHPDGFAPAPEDHKPHGAQPLEEPGWAEGPNEAPVLAADEIEPGAERLQPAISPAFELVSPGLNTHSRSNSRTENRASSQASSTRGAVPNMTKFGSRSEEREETHTELEDVKEYEPLFPNDDDEAKITTPVERFKRRPEQYRFPSKDIWEDAPVSLQLEATVTTPDVPSKSSDNEEKPPLGPPAEEALQSKSEIPSKPSSPTKELQIHLEDEKPHGAESRQRFPSKDVWDDVPDSQRLVTTVQTPQEGEKWTAPESPTKSSPPTIPARPSKSISPVEGKAPSPAEPRKPPTIPSRPKPKPPARPAKPSSRNSDESLTKTVSAGSTDATAPPGVKPKPPIPSRPGGSKIAALKAGFLSQLEGHLKLGPQGPKPQEKKPEPEETVEKVPLSDARKGRARGPARRKPAVPTAVPPAEPVRKPAPAPPKFKVVNAWNVWRIGGNGVLVVCDTSPAKARSAPPPPDLPTKTIPEPQPSARSEQASSPSSPTATTATPAALPVTQTPDTDADAVGDSSPETTSKPAPTKEPDEPAAVARDSSTASSSSPLRNPAPTPSASSHNDDDGDGDGNGLEAQPPQQEPLVEAEIEPGDETPLVAEPGQEKTGSPGPDEADEADVEQTSVQTKTLEKSPSGTSDSAGTTS